MTAVSFANWRAGTGKRKAIWNFKIAWQFAKNFCGSKNNCLTSSIRARRPKSRRSHHRLLALIGAAFFLGSFASKAIPKRMSRRSEALQGCRRSQRRSILDSRSSNAGMQSNQEMVPTMSTMTAKANTSSFLATSAICILAGTGHRTAIWNLKIPWGRIQVRGQVCH